MLNKCDWEYTRCASLLRQPKIILQTGWLKQWTLICSQFWKLEVQDQGSCKFSSWWELSSWLVDGHLPPVCPHGLSSVYGQGERERTSFLVILLIRTLILLDQGPTLMTSFNPNYFLRGPISTLVEATLGVKPSTCEFVGRGGTNISVHNTWTRKTLRANAKERKESQRSHKKYFSQETICLLGWGGS